MNRDKEFILFLALIVACTGAFGAAGPVVAILAHALLRWEAVR